MARAPTAPVYVYIWYRPDTDEPFYVGVGVRNRGRSLARRNRFTLNVVRKFGGIESIRIETRPMASWDAGLEEEKRLIAKFGRKDKGKGTLTNGTDGGEGALGRPLSERTREVLDVARRTRVWTPEQREKVAAAQRNKLVTQATRDKLADKFRGKARPPEVQAILRENLRKAALTGSGGWIGSDANKRQLRGVAEKSKAWHASLTGIEEHKRIGKESWKKRDWIEKNCIECGRPYLTPWPTRSKFCHLNCKMAALRKRRGVPVHGPRVLPQLPPSKRASSKD